MKLTASCASRARLPWNLHDSSRRKRLHLKLPGNSNRRISIGSASASYPGGQEARSGVRALPQFIGMMMAYEYSQDQDHCGGIHSAVSLLFFLAHRTPWPSFAHLCVFGENGVGDGHERRSGSNAWRTAPAFISYLLHSWRKQ